METLYSILHKIMDLTKNNFNSFTVNDNHNYYECGEIILK